MLGDGNDVVLCKLPEVSVSVWALGALHGHSNIRKVRRKQVDELRKYNYC